MSRRAARNAAQALEHRQKAHERSVSRSKSGGKEFKRPGSQSPKKNGLTQDK